MPILKSIFSLFSGSKSTEKNKASDLSIKPSKDNNTYVASGFNDVVDGLQFSPTFLLRTPCEILKSNGMHVIDDTQIPKHLKDQKYGVWIPKLKRKSFTGSDVVGASDAYGVTQDDYISYVCAVKDIYCRQGHILDRTSLLEQYRSDNKELLYVEKKLLEYYDNHNSIIDLLMFKIHYSFEDLVILRYRDKGYIKRIFDVNARVEESLINAGYETAEIIVNLSKDNLVKLDGIGSKSADKILATSEKIVTLIHSG
ncbi:hypothetical protein EQ875_02234 [Photobacterium damselae subsp. damselae]|uniref:helix-hairpin-helix domain-containing protein n=1 Tax=Photobacterium damselae TaxID=38293 RepID=UPI00109BCDDB|nr:helix-hairpin-helix domain-containing protein [Photobacterium damselae]TGZ34503.1 hypothetical protein EQ875_02234 [Photobacterium damselae subsp. damselae]